MNILGLGAKFVKSHHIIEINKQQSHSGVEQDISTVANLSINRKDEAHTDLKDHSATEKSSYVFEPDDEMMKAFNKCNKNSNYLNLACLKSYINAYDKTLKTESIWTQIATFISRYIFFNATITKADQLFIKNYFALNKKERAYIDLIDSYNKPYIDDFIINKRIILPEGGTYQGPIGYGKPVGQGNVKELPLPGGGIYTGSVFNGVPKGEGNVKKLPLPGGGIYTGSVFDRFPKGKGNVKELPLPGGGIYTGSVFDGVPSGKGKVVGLKVTKGEYKGGFYTGSTNNGIPDGGGALTFSGFVFRGNFSKGEMIKEEIIATDRGEEVDLENEFAIKALMNFSPNPAACTWFACAFVNSTESATQEFINNLLIENVYTGNEFFLETDECIGNFPELSLATNPFKEQDLSSMQVSFEKNNPYSLTEAINSLAQSPNIKGAVITANGSTMGMRFIDNYIEIFESHEEPDTGNIAFIRRFSNQERAVEYLHTKFTYMGFSKVIEIWPLQSIA